MSGVGVRMGCGEDGKNPRFGRSRVFQVPGLDVVEWRESGGAMLSGLLAPHPNRLGGPRNREDLCHHLQGKAWGGGKTSGHFLSHVAQSAW